MRLSWGSCGALNSFCATRSSCISDFSAPACQVAKISGLCYQAQLGCAYLQWIWARLQKHWALQWSCLLSFPILRSLATEITSPPSLPACITSFPQGNIPICSGNKPGMDTKILRCQQLPAQFLLNWPQYCESCCLWFLICAAVVRTWIWCSCPAPAHPYTIISISMLSASLRSFNTTGMIGGFASNCSANCYLS